jgi:catechol 2,3-dioxygenase-like lactoylglutathione lyase family enzyme
MSGRVIGLDHVDIVVGNPDEMAMFLAAVGFKVIRRTGGVRGSIEMSFPGSEIVLELTPSRRADGGGLDLGLRHLALRCDDLDAAVTELTAAGLSFTGPVRTIADTGRRVANVTDPDGRILQFTE